MLRVFLCISFSFFNIAQAQDIFFSDQDNEIEYISWVKQFPSSEKIKTGIGKRIANFIFGNYKLDLNRPVAVLAKNLDYCWTLDQENKTILQFNTQKGDQSPQLVNKKFNDFPSLVGLCFIPDNYILFTDSYTNKIYKVSDDGKKFQVLNESLLLDQPTGIAYSKTNREIYVVETDAHRIVVLDEKGKLKREIGQRGNVPGEFNFPTSIWIDDSGTVYVVDAMNFRIQIFDKADELISVFGTMGDATGYFARPKGIATDSYGNIYVADALFHVVQIFDQSGNFLYKFGEQGHDEGQFWMPSGIFIDQDNYIYVADSYNSRIQVFHLIKEGVK